MTATQARTPGPMSSDASRIYRETSDASGRFAPTAPVEDVSREAPETNTSLERVKETGKNEHVSAPVEASGSELTSAIKAVQDAELKFRRGAAVGGLKGSDFTHYAQLQIAIKAAVVAVGGTWK